MTMIPSSTINAHMDRVLDQEWWRGVWVGLFVGSIVGSIVAWVCVILLYVSFYQ